jgi:hypothetical protein
MTRNLSKWTAIVVPIAVTALASAALANDAQDPLKGRHQRHVAHHSGDLYVHTGRSYLDPGPTEIVGTRNRYVSDSLPTSFAEFGTPFTAHAGGTDLIPTRFSVPGRQEPLFQFWGF